MGLTRSLSVLCGNVRRLRQQKGFMERANLKNRKAIFEICSLLISCGCIISHSAATAAVVNSLEAHVFEKLLRNFSKTCASKEFYLPPQAAI
jgi:hypothetical protein